MEDAERPLAADGDAEFHADRVAELTEEDYVAVTQETFVGEAIEAFREFEPVSDETTIYYLYVTDNFGRLVGVMSLRELLNAPEDDVVETHMHTDLVTINADDDPEYAVDKVADHDFPALPVVDDKGVLMGVLRTEDMIGVVEEEATEDIMKSAGFTFTDVESARSQSILESSIPRILRLRMPWLLLALAGGLLAGGVIEQFEDTLEAVVALAFFVPVIMDMGGNVGTQASTIFVRGLALGHIDDRNAMRHFGREGLVGLLIGLLIGSVGALAAFIWQRNEPFAVELALVVFIALVSVCVVASVFGYVIPWTMHKLGFDPAAASDPLITTVKDVSALIIYFGLAAVLLAELI
ncbi:MAG: magnesium transporter [Halalkalicoccus sp.]